MTHDYKRNGATTLFASMNILDGTVIGRCMSQHRRQEFIRFLNGVERAVPAGKVIHAILDNYGAHKHPNVVKWLADHPRWTFHFTPTSASWRGRRIFLDHLAPKNPTRRVQIRGRSRRRHQPLYQGAQQNIKAFRMDRVSPLSSKSSIEPLNPPNEPTLKRACGVGIGAITRTAWREYFADSRAEPPGRLMLTSRFGSPAHAEDLPRRYFGNRARSTVSRESAQPRAREPSKTAQTPAFGRCSEYGDARRRPQPGRSLTHGQFNLDCDLFTL
jgi:hypothetical protein